MQGQVVRIKQIEGYGFIRGEDNVERFFHRSSLQNGHWDTVQVGDAVEFDHADADRGARAENVLLVR